MSAEYGSLNAQRARQRSGSHLLLRGQTWYYRRVVPVECRAAFGCSAVAISLHTPSRLDAERLEKRHDVEFERRLEEAGKVSG
jgi:hypothetical protein